ncbi:MAG TPA: CPBP family intramembrane glutamic endopeptidase [Candidatus Binatia bacterium]|nr:CPBP family intramembrane glutamic endopeptidase [Candidatus Binatia bacterium]
MVIGNQIGIGPAVRVFRHFTERQRVYKLKFESGERALVLIAGLPAPSVELVRLVLGGVFPWQTVWEFNPTRAGGYSDYVHKLKTMFSPTGESDDSLHYIRDALLRCQSIQEARTLLLERERLVNGEIADGFPRYEPRSVPSSDNWDLGIRSPHYGSSPERAKISVIPDRYRVRKDAKGRILRCVEAPTVTIRAVVRGVAIPAKQARKYPPGTIFLDGAAQGDPFVDAQKEIYNLDHREGCIQSLATCEQALILVRKNLDLRKRDWVVLANDADLDTVFALWVLLNHLRLNGDSEVRAKVVPLFRLEGIIDAHGLDLHDLAALPPDLLDSTFAMLKALRQREIVPDADGRWTEIELLDCIADRLRLVDELIYAPKDFDGLHEIDELARAEIANGSLAVACRSDAGMDEVERQLQRIHGERLGILIFENAPANYRVHQLDRMLPATLERAYERLNLLDPVVRGGFQNRWGGAAEIGGSPRNNGTGLVPTQIVEAVREAFRQPALADVVCEIPRAVFLGVAALLPALALIFAGNLLRNGGYIAAEPVLLPAVVLSVTVGILFWFKARGSPGLYGWRVPIGVGWLTVLPGALIGAVIGGVWAPTALGHRLSPENLYEFTAPVALLLPVAAELLFRGVILGSLALRLPIKRNGGPCSGSWPTLISSALYAAATLFLFLIFSSGQLQMSQGLLIAAGALTFGIASGIARERSESILASVLLHWVCAAALLSFGSFLF